ncbi:hypothetical protein B6A27_02050 [Anoxybacillus sp. UARK-01]|uniref:Uncharacterized protein n=1 Tax=Anoxybacteroides rupiense TaxID=311460 RepID=A0ABD5J1E0_9BACL|nr:MULTISPECIES: hypothetical protein [Anoxybacillus]MBB3909360.1 hypothetical protein [Anoxybacillus rupiensis]MED5053689.1 hypothetical protein [Anoxybacillus rupiensis]OQM47198.1 hypothetical protein B6A27_02050 [Anoxybacillus sp. UARK-01]
MQNEMKYFLIDLIKEIQEKYNQTLTEVEEESLEEKNYRLGTNFAYYDVLELIESQLKSFDYRLGEIGQITPTLGEKIANNSLK